MIIRFKKETHKPSTLTCIRADGSLTFTSLNPAIEIHDLAHYVVETELGFGNAFYGLIQKGFNIEDFERTQEQKPEELLPKNLPIEALQTEHIVNLLQIHFLNDDSDFNLISSLKTILASQEIEFPDQLNQERLAIILEKLRTLYGKWNTLQSGEQLELAFEAT